jgi:hypothetical protein
LFYEDSAAEPEYTWLPPLMGDDVRPVDVAIICAGNFGNAKDYPTALIDHLHPRYVIIGHWEDFFRSPFPPFSAIPNNSSSELVKRVVNGVNQNWVTPEPRTHLVFRF